MARHRIGMQLSLATRRELIQAIAELYLAGGESMPLGPGFFAL